MCLSIKEVNVEQDLSGLKCPLPVLRTKKALANMIEGQLLRVITTDPSSYNDIIAFAKLAGSSVVDARLTEYGAMLILRR